MNIQGGRASKMLEGKAIGVDLQEQTKLSCFSLNSDGTVTCPMECVLTKIKTKGGNSISSSKEAFR